MRPPFGYYGGKARIAPWIASLFPAHDTYVEPFCGSAAVLFAKRPASYELINDRAGDVVNFFRVLRDRPEDLIGVLELTPYARDELHLAIEPCEDELERARRWWVRSTQSFSGAVTKTRSWGLSTRMRGWRPATVRRKVERLMAAAERIRDVAIENRDACDVIETYADGRTVVYADPPYLFSTRRGPDYGYVDEFGDEQEHRRLAKTLRDTPAVVFLSGYPSPLYDELYDGWHRIERSVAVSSAAARGVRKAYATECLWTNRPLARQLTLAEAEVGR